MPDASSIARLADAYVLLPTSHAACHSQLTDFDLYRFAHWRHSIQHENTYLNQFEAVMSAWKLSWSVLRDSFQNVIEPNSPFDIAGCRPMADLGLHDSLHSSVASENPEPPTCVMLVRSSIRVSCSIVASEHLLRVTITIPKVFVS